LLSLPIRKGIILCEEVRMVSRYQKPARPAEGERREKKPQDVHAGDDPCRCQETSNMTPRELLRLMLSDLSFWKKTKKN